MWCATAGDQGFDATPASSLTRPDEVFGKDTDKDRHRPDTSGVPSRRAFPHRCKTLEPAVSYDDEPSVADIPTNVPTSARAYGWLLGGKDNYEIDRDFVRGQLQAFPAGLDITRQNRLFLYRAVHYLSEAGIRQFIDMGCGLPTDNNVHQVAEQFAPDTRVVYVDIDRSKSGCAHGG
jgi:hypothetical protein